MCAVKLTGPDEGLSNGSSLFTMSKQHAQPKPCASGEPAVLACGTFMRMSLLFPDGTKEPTTPQGIVGNWWSLTGSNRRHPACKAGALPAELRPLVHRRAPTKGAILLPRAPARASARSRYRAIRRACPVGHGEERLSPDPQGIDTRKTGGPG